MMTRLAIMCDEVEIGYAGRRVLGGVSFRVQQGQSVVILGHNGAGKSTLLRTLFGLHASLSGTFEIADLQGASVTPRSLIIQGVRFLGQGTRCFQHLSVKASRQVLARQYGSLASCFPSPWATNVRLTTCVGKLSIGERKLEALTLLSAGNPRLFLLDEPLAGLDDRNKEAVARWVEELASKGVSFVIAEHEFVEFASIIEHALVIREGKVTYFGELKKLISDRGLFADVYL